MIRRKETLLLLLLAIILVACRSEPEGPVIVATPVPTTEPTSASAAITPEGLESLPTREESAPTKESTTTIEPESTEAPAALPTATPTSEPYPVVSPSPTRSSAYPGPSDVTTSDPTGLQLALELVLSGLESPLGIANAGDGSGRLFIVEKAGFIRVVEDGALEPEPFLDIQDRVNSSANEQGLLGLAFHPRFADNGFFFVAYTDLEGDMVFSRFQANADRSAADPAGEAEVLTVEQPADNHNGGHLAFGPDGYLYVGLGDGGGAGDQYENGQNKTSWLGGLLRIDVDELPYSVPDDNPFLTDPAANDELWAIGLRNPWRFSFDRLTGDLYIADVGQEKYEEVNFQTAGDSGGQNYGWPITEGSHCYPDDDGQCVLFPLALPVAEYDHSQGCSIIGGHVYRGEAYPQMSGVYLFGDYCSGRIWGLARDAEGYWLVAELAQTDVQISAFGEDEGGELYLVSLDSGELYRIRIIGT